MKVQAVAAEEAEEVSALKAENARLRAEVEQAHQGPERIAQEQDRDYPDLPGAGFCEDPWTLLPES